MNPVRLSICIATLNRGAFIGETLESIISQLSDGVEIVVADGASTDHTGEVVRGLAARCPQLRYIRLERNSGADQDYNNAVELGRGDYCWLFTDDDLLKPGAVAAVLQAIREDYDLIVVNAEVRTENFAVCLQPRRMRMDQDEVYEPTPGGWDRLLARTGCYLSFIGGVVIRRDLWLRREKEKYFGSLFIHVGMIFQKLLPGKALVMAHPWVVIRYGNAKWTSRSFEIWLFKWPHLVWSFPDFSDWAKEQVEKREPWRRWRRLAIERALGHYSTNEYALWVKPRLESWIGRLVSRAIAVFPVFPLNWLARLYTRAVGKVPSIGWYDLEAWRKSRLTPPGSK